MAIAHYAAMTEQEILKAAAEIRGRRGGMAGKGASKRRSAEHYARSLAKARLARAANLAKPVSNSPIVSG